MNDKIKKIIKEGLKYIVFAVIVFNAASYYRSMDLNKEKLEYKSFKLLDETIYTVQSDKPILIHFWATWCPVCKLEAPNIEKISKNFEVISIATQSGSKKEIQQYMIDNKLTFNVVNDNDGKYSKAFNISVFPTTFIYDKNKELQFTEVGYTTTADLYTRMLSVK